MSPELRASILESAKKMSSRLSEKCEERRLEKEVERLKRDNLNLRVKVNNLKAKIKNMETRKPKTVQDTILSYLREHPFKGLTEDIAGSKYGIKNVKYVIWDLRKKGIKIETRMGKDKAGRRFARYHMSE